MALISFLYDYCHLARGEKELRHLHLSLIDVATSHDIRKQNKDSLFNLLFSEGVAKGYYPYSHIRHYLDEGASIEVALLASVRNLPLFKALVTMYCVGNETLGTVASYSIVKGKMPPFEMLRYLVARGVTLSRKGLAAAISSEGGDVSTAEFLLDVFRDEYQNVRVHARDLDRTLGKETLARAAYREDCYHLFSKHTKDIADMLIRYL